MSMRAFTHSFIIYLYLSPWLNRQGPLILMYHLVNVRKYLLNEGMKTALQKEGFHIKTFLVIILILENKAQKICHSDTSFLFTKSICYQKQQVKGKLL